jgi:hypothetical protein
MPLASLLDVIDSLDCVDCLRPQLAIVFDWSISALLELEAWIDGELFAGQLAIGFRPFCLSRVLLSLERLPALLATESELLQAERRESREVPEVKNLATYFAVVSDEKHSVTRINFAGAEVARLYPHFGWFSVAVCCLFLTKLINFAATSTCFVYFKLLKIAARGAAVLRYSAQRILNFEQPFNLSR